MKKLHSMLLCFVYITQMYSFDHPHFYRSPSFISAFHEPRLTRDWLTSLDVHLWGGSTHTGRIGNIHCGIGCKPDMLATECGTKTGLLNICGFHNMHHVGAGISNLDTNNELDMLLILLDTIPDRSTFGQLEFCGHFHIAETSISLSKNFVCGFFIQAHLPIRRLGIDDIFYIDKSPADNIYPHAHIPEWKAFLNSFDRILQRFCIDIHESKKTGIGDVSFHIGWTHSYLDTEVIDFFDITLKAGILIPTGKKKNVNQPFDMPHGYNGYIGIPLNIAVALGLYEWLNIGLHGHIMPFIHNTQDIRMKTDMNQSGFIYLATGVATITPGPLWGITTYLKADHFIGGLSFLVGYSFNKKHADDVCPCSDCFIPSVVQSACEFKGWNMHTVHLLAEYEWTLKRWDATPRIGIHYNINVGGETVFKTNTIGGSLGIDAVFKF